MGDGKERFPSHLQVCATRERQVGDVLQVIEAVKIQPTSAYEPLSYRMVEVKNGNARKVEHICDTLKEARWRFDRRLRRAAVREP